MNRHANNNNNNNDNDNNKINRKKKERGASTGKILGSNQSQWAHMDEKMTQRRMNH